MPNIGGVLKQATVDVGAAVKDVGKEVIGNDEVGKAIEQGAQSTTQNPQIDPAIQQQKRLEEQKKRNEALWVIDRYKKIDQAQMQVRQASKQEEMQKKQVEEQQKQKVQQYKVVEQQKRQQVMAVQQAQTRTEVKKGGG